MHQSMQGSKVFHWCSDISMIQKLMHLCIDLTPSCTTATQPGHQAARQTPDPQHILSATCYE